MGWAYRNGDVVLAFAGAVGAFVLGYLPLGVGGAVGGAAMAALFVFLISNMAPIPPAYGPYQ